METTARHDFETVLRALGVTESTLTPAQRKSLDEEGYFVAPGLIPPDELQQFRATFEDQSRKQSSNLQNAASGTRHLNGLAGGRLFQRIYTHPKLLAAVWQVLKRPFRLGELQGRDPLPGYGQQGLHADWRPRQPGEPFRVVNSLWLLDEFTAENGATRVVPGTHLLPHAPGKHAGDPSSRHPEEVIITAAAGAALIFNGHLWHSGRQNRSQGPRRVLQCSWIDRFQPSFSEPIENLDHLSPEARIILGAS